jgi:hypothetical protein
VCDEVGEVTVIGRRPKELDPFEDQMLEILKVVKNPEEGTVRERSSFGV